MRTMVMPACSSKSSCHMVCIFQSGAEKIICYNKLMERATLHKLIKDDYKVPSSFLFKTVSFDESGVYCASHTGKTLFKEEFVLIVLQNESKVKWYPLILYHLNLFQDPTSLNAKNLESAERCTALWEFIHGV